MSSSAAATTGDGGGGARSAKQPRVELPAPPAGSLVNPRDVHLTPEEHATLRAFLLRDSVPEADVDALINNYLIWMELRYLKATGKWGVRTSKAAVLLPAAEVSSVSAAAASGNRADVLAALQSQGTPKFWEKALDDEPLGISTGLDRAWHAHILCTSHYVDFCARHFKSYVHHNPLVPAVEAYPRAAVALVTAIREGIVARPSPGELAAYWPGVTPADLDAAEARIWDTAAYKPTRRERDEELARYREYAHYANDCG
jgi:hypothetical protein